MAEWLVLCGGQPVPRRRTHARIIHLDTRKMAAPQHRVNLHLDDIGGPLLDNIPDVVVDALEVAAYVFSADRLISRGTAQMARMGADWRRRLRFVIPVRCLDRWNRPEVHDALVDALSFLSEDAYSFEFVLQHATEGIAPYLGFRDPDAQVIAPDDVILFSGGLDSLAGVTERLREGDANVVLVTHRSSTTIAGLQDDLVRHLIERSRPRQMFYTPVWVKKGDQDPKEFTQRTRSFLFATLGMAVARMFERASILLYENGVTTFNLPISEHVLGARASRTTHPRSLALFENLFSQLLDEEFRIRNPFLWETKSEIIERLARNGGGDLIAGAVSCANVRALSMTGRQCGVCSQCIERRFAVLAAGVEEWDPQEGYAVDLFRGGHERPQHLTMIEQFVLRARKLAAMSLHAFLAAYGQVFRALPDLPGPPDENARRIYELHRRHGGSVLEVIDRELSRTTFEELLNLPETSLLAMIRSTRAADDVVADPTERELPPSSEAARDPRSYAGRSLVLAVDQKRKRIVFEGGVELGGNGYELIAALAEHRQREIHAEISGESYEYVSTGSLCDRFDVDDQNLRQRVHRTRKKLARQFLELRHYVLDERDIIESDAWRGYRLNQFLLLVKPHQLPQSPVMSRSPSTKVTA